MKDKKLKEYIVDRKLDKIVRTHSYMLYASREYGLYFKYLDTYDNVVNNLNEDQKRVIHNLNNTRYYRIKKCKDFITDCIIDLSLETNLKCVFLTFTFNDATLKETTELARRKRIRRILDKNCVNYVANIDFGTKNEREHYHAIALLRYDYDFSKAEKNGYYYVEPIQVNDDSIEKLSKYINKLTYHAIKDTTQHDNSNYRLIYKCKLM